MSFKAEDNLSMQWQLRTQDDAEFLSPAESVRRVEFYQSHLDRVSRSFAFCIARLDTELRERVGLSYLLCRLLDTIEDMEWASFADQETAFFAFDDFLNRPPHVETIQSWLLRFPPGVSAGERALLNDTYVLLNDFHRWTESIRLPILELILTMSRGMRYFMERKSRIGKLKLNDSKDVNEYCFFVAGVVGEMLTRLVSREQMPTRKMLNDGFHFGLFLQKVNLLKDQSGDERQGRELVPSRGHLLANLLKDADGGFRYLMSLRDVEVGFRLFCAWSLFLGLASLPWIQASHKQGKSFRIPREETLTLLGEIEELIDVESGLTQLYRTLRAQAVRGPIETENNEALEAGNLDAPADPEEAKLLQFYKGQLSEADVLRLFRS